MAVYEDLLELFAAHRIDAVTADNGKLLRDKFGKSIEELGADAEYTKHYDVVRDTKKCLEETLDSCQGDIRKEINECIWKIESFRERSRTEAAETFSQLVKRSVYKDRWGDKERRLYDRKYQLVFNWQHYFLSYTNRDYFKTYNSFKKLIDHNLEPDVRKNALSTKANVLAHLVAQLIEQTGMRGFFDYKKIKSGDDIEDAIRQHCKTAYVFIQLVEYVTFNPPAHGKNWCFEEYDEFAKETEMSDLSGCPHDKRYHFVITVDDISKLKPIFPYPPYSCWVDHAARVHDKKVRDGRRLDALRRDIQEIATEIKTLRDAIVYNTLQR
jgi:hypothetical protein